MDGALSQEKAETHQKRAATLEKNTKKLRNLVEGLIGSEKKRFSRAVWRSVEKRTDQCSGLEPFRFPEQINQVNAPFEADVYIGRQPANVLAISNDSDLIYQPNRAFVARPVRDGKSALFKVIFYINFKLYCKTDILAKLDLSQNAFTALGIISGNDYCRNVPGYGIKKNLIILQTLPPTTTRSLVTSYLAFVKQENKE